MSFCSPEKNTTSSSTSNYSATTTPNVPDWIADPDQQYITKVKSLLGQDPSSFIAPATSTQQQAFKGASNLGSWNGTLNGAQGMVGQATSTPAPMTNGTGYTAAQATTPQIDPATLIKNMLSGGGWQDYMNPELQAVINPTLANYDINAGHDQAALDASAGLNKAFGGSGFALQKADLTNSQELGRASTEAGLRSNAYDRAAGLAATDAGAINQRALSQGGIDASIASGNRDATNAASSQTAQSDATAKLANQDSQNQAIKNLLAGAGLTADIGNSQATNAQNDVTTQLNAGNTERAITQAQASAPLTTLAALQQLLGFNPQQFIGSSTDGTMSSNSKTRVVDSQSTLDQIMKGIQVAGQVAAMMG